MCHQIKHFELLGKNFSSECIFYFLKSTYGMAVVVDKAIWPYKGKLWAHLASDNNLSELHDFAELLGLRLMSFQGDHYDVSKEVRDRAIVLGAIEIDGRELLSRLKKAKLRLSASERPGKWEEICSFPPTGTPPNLSEIKLNKVVPELEKLVRVNWEFVEVTIFQRRNEMALVLEGSNGLIIESDFLRKFDWRFTGGKLLEILI